MDVAMTRCSLLIAAITFIAVAVARSGHELPVYPSYYPHEIDIAAVVPERAADLLRDGKMHAYVGGTPRFAGAMPETITAVESFGSFVIVRVNPASPLAKDEASICALTRAAIREIGGKASELITHPYPVTPFHGDFLNHVHLAAAAKARLLGSLTEATGAVVGELKVRAVGALARSLVRAEWQAGDYDGAVERINLERGLVGMLVGSCHKTVAGYTVKREYFNSEFSAGIENVA